MRHVAEFTHQNLRIVGFSLAGEETFLALPELNLAFDMGRAPREIVSIDHVFLTHGHMDHAAGIAYYFAQRWFQDNDPGHLYLAEGLLNPVQRLLRVWAEIDGHEPPARLHVVRPGEDVVLRRDLLVRPFEVNHPGPRAQHGPATSALGFAAIEVRHKLRPELQELTGPQIVELKKKGVEVTRRVEIPLVAYCGDTGPGTFFELDFVRNARVLLLECTFLAAEHRDRARAGAHMHLSDLKNVLPSLRNERIVLTHLSRRLAVRQARDILRAELGPEYEGRVCLLMDFRRRARGGSPSGAAGG
jgi:ribonuclease Z